jgi:RimJ/RimL family protein N-acetyltransferase
MAAFTAPDHMDRDAFERRWLRADETVISRVIVVDGEVAGTIRSWGDPGKREVTYWIGRSHWGKGIATRTLNAFLTVDPSRPLHARVAHDNVASRRVLEKCGFPSSPLNEASLKHAPAKFDVENLRPAPLTS